VEAFVLALGLRVKEVPVDEAHDSLQQPDSEAGVAVHGGAPRRVVVAEDGGGQAVEREETLPDGLDGGDLFVGAGEQFHEAAGVVVEQGGGPRHASASRKWRLKSIAPSSLGHPRSKRTKAARAREASGMTQPLRLIRRASELREDAAVPCCSSRLQSLRGPQKGNSRRNSSKACSAASGVWLERRVRRGTGGQNWSFAHRA
jgi:hypothetical protein